ncbi:MAG: hypothetical protein ACRDBO_06100 [Lachnospiraceae bacterium]
MAIVKTYKKGNTTIRIHDDCMAKTEEERQAILDEVKRLVENNYRRKDETA